MGRPHGTEPGIAKSSSLPSSSVRVEVPSFTEIRNRTNEVFGVQPCLWQMKVAAAILRGDKDVICTAGTGMGKTLTFWIPLLFRPGGIQVVVTPLNLLGQQNATSLEKAGIRAISMNSETATTANFQAIRAFKYRAIIVSPEQIMKPGGEFEKLLKCKLFVSRIISIVIDEAHCLTEWGNFRPEYRELGRLHYVLPSSIPLLVTSATLTKHAFADITSLLHIPSHRRSVIRRSSDRPNIKIGVKKIKYSRGSFADLAFLIPAGFKVGDPPPPKFLIFFDDIPASVNAANMLRRRLPFTLQDKIKWFNANMSTAFKETELANLVNGDCWGLCTTTSFGMGMDVSDVELVVQWRATCTLPSLWQRFGRAVRDKALNGTALLFAEKDHFDDERRAKAAKKAHQVVTKKRTSKDANLPRALRSPKRLALSPANQNTHQPESSVNDVHGGLNDSAAAPLVIPVSLEKTHHGEELSDSDEDDDDSDMELPTVMSACGSRAETASRTSDDTGIEALLKAMSQESKRSNEGGHGRKQKKRVLDPGMEFLINAGDRGLGCRRNVFDVCFDNASADSDHRECNPANTEGCYRCHIMEPAICCDVHQPSEFAQYDVSINSTTRNARRSRITKTTWDKHDLALLDALEGWREEKTVMVYGGACLDDYGPSVIMPTSILDRIVNCSHHHKLHSIEDLKRETGWTDSERFGAEVVALVKQYAAPSPSPFTTTPLRLNTPISALRCPTTSSPSTPSAPMLPVLSGPSDSESLQVQVVQPVISKPVPRARRPVRCSACGEEGHNGEYQAHPAGPAIPSASVRAHRDHDSPQPNMQNVLNLAHTHGEQREQCE